MSETHLWQTLVTTALLGSSKQPPLLPQSGTALGDLVAHLDQSDSEGSLLGAAALVTLYYRAGRLPLADMTLVPVPAEAETSRPCSPKSTQHLLNMLSGQYREVLPEWLRAAAGRYVAPETLPTLLTLGNSDSSWRPYIAAVLGKRGLWLAAQNPEWSYALGEDDTNTEEVWQTGSRTARQLLLSRLRSTAPQQAREMLASTWAQESGEERAALLEQFQTGLSMADEPFLEAALDDKRGAVSDTATALLSQLAESRYCQRMFERTRQLISFQPAKTEKWITFEVNLPASVDAAMKRDGLEVGKKAKGGEKAAWLKKMLSAVPPWRWTQLWGISAAELILGVSHNKDWSYLLLQSLATATWRHQDWAMATALLDEFFVGDVPLDTDTFLKILPPQDRDTFIIKLLWTDKTNVSVADYTARFTWLNQCSFAWGVDLSRAALAVFQHHITHSTNTYDYQVQAALKTAGRYIDPQLAQEATQGWPREAKLWPNWEPKVEEFLALLQFRQDMLNELSV
jgi:hypothetical protein